MAKRTCSELDCDKPHRARGLCQMHYKRAGHSPRTKYPRTCEACATDYLSDRASGRFCSDTCKAATYRIEKRVHSRELVGPVERNYCELPARHPARQVQARPHVWYMGHCAWCAASFTDWQPWSRYCSTRCGRRAGGARKRKRMGYPKLTLTQAERVTIYRRDDATRQLCLEPVDLDLMYTTPNDDWAPSLDHIVTRVTGGSDEPSNLRLAHRWCNSVRSDETYYTPDALRISCVA